MAKTIKTNPQAVENWARMVFIAFCKALGLSSSVRHFLNNTTLNTRVVLPVTSSVIIHIKDGDITILNVSKGKSATARHNPTDKYSPVYGIALAWARYNGETEYIVEEKPKVTATAGVIPIPNPEMYNIIQRIGDVPIGTEVLARESTTGTNYLAIVKEKSASEVIIETRSNPVGLGKASPDENVLVSNID